MHKTDNFQWSCSTFFNPVCVCVSLLSVTLRATNRRNASGSVVSANKLSSPEKASFLVEFLATRRKQYLCWVLSPVLRPIHKRSKSQNKHSKRPARCRRTNETAVPTEICASLLQECGKGNLRNIGFGVRPLVRERVKRANPTRTVICSYCPCRWSSNGHGMHVVGKLFPNFVGCCLLY